MVAKPAGEISASPQTPVDVVIAVFGGVRAAARAINLSANCLKSWQKPGPRRAAGLVPSAHHRDYLEAARERGLSLSEHDLIWGRP